MRLLLPSSNKAAMRPGRTTTSLSCTIGKGFTKRQRFTLLRQRLSAFGSRFQQGCEGGWQPRGDPFKKRKTASKNQRHYGEHGRGPG